MRDDWTETTIGDVAKASWGNTTVTKKQYKESGFTAFSASGPDGFVDWFEHDEKGVVLSAIGALCGKTWLAEGKWTPIKNTIWFKSISKECLTDYLFLVSKTPDLWPIRGQAQPFISLGDVRLVEISMPPLAEQKRIVDVVSSVDAYIDALQQQADTARTARNAVLHELLSAGGDNWTETTLGEISELVSRGRAPSYCDDDGVVVLNQKCVRYGRIFFEFARRTDTTKKTIPEWAYLKVGDTLINSTGVGTLGRASFVSCLDGPTTFDSHVTLVRPRHDSSFPEFIGMTLNLLENEIEMFAGGSTGQTELSREAVNSF